MDCRAAVQGRARAAGTQNGLYHKAVRAATPTAAQRSERCRQSHGRKGPVRPVHLQLLQVLSAFVPAPASMLLETQRSRRGYPESRNAPPSTRDVVGLPNRNACARMGTLGGASTLVASRDLSCSNEREDAPQPHAAVPKPSFRRSGATEESKNPSRTRRNDVICFAQDQRLPASGTA